MDSATTTATTTTPAAAGEATADDPPAKQGGEGVAADPRPSSTNIDPPAGELSTMVISEAQFAKLSGIDRGVIRSHRDANFEEGEHWKRGEQGMIELLQIGISELCKSYEIEPDCFEPEKNQKKGAVIELKASKKCRPANSRLVLCDAPSGYSGPTPIRVRVRTNAKFIPGMAVPAIQTGPAPDLWDFAGKRLPKSRGRY